MFTNARPGGRSLTGGEEDCVAVSAVAHRWRVLSPLVAARRSLACRARLHVICYGWVGVVGPSKEGRHGGAADRLRAVAVGLAERVDPSPQVGNGSVSEVTLRSARVERADGERFAQYLDQAADNTFRALLGPQSMRIVAEAFLAPGHDLSYEYVTFAETAGEVVGMLSGYSAEEHATSSDEPLVAAAGFRTYRMAVLHRLGARIFDFMDRLPDGDWYVQAVAVDESGRGKGVGSALLQNAEHTARTAGCERITLDVAVNNDGARRLYERLGYEVESSSKPIPLVPSAAVHRMVKPL